MSSFNPFSVPSVDTRTMRPAHSPEQRSYILQPTKTTIHACLEQSNGNISLDEFDRQLLAGSQTESMVELVSLATPVSNEPSTFSTRRLIHPNEGKVNDLHTSNASDAAPFSSPILAVQQRKQQQQLSLHGGHLHTRNAFHDRLKKFDEEGLQNKVDEASRTKFPTRGAQSFDQGPKIRGIDLVPTTKLSDRHRTVFKFPIFNAVQSRCFSTAYESDDNLVVSAPTGSGKTVMMELGILRLMDSLKSGHAKVVYQAPTKSLCSERYRDWQTKFGVFDIHCAEMTGDTEQNHLRNVATASIIITTPEKWDSITRKWKDNAKLMNMIRLFLVDEVHILKDTRGATLEAIVSRMKTVGNNIRFIALSATIPNSEDIAVWLTRNEQARHLPAVREVFDDSFRPVQLKKHILGQDGPYNPWALDSTLTEKIPDIVIRYSRRKPVMVFCPTKESAQKTAQRLAQSWQEFAGQVPPWNGPSIVAKVENEMLQKLLPAAVAFHHASLGVDDRNIVERAFLNGDINIICSTSTLAVGVNLPCYLVVLKGTQGYTNSGLSEYSSLEVMQMLGRAGRSQFETEACAVILCLKDRLPKYEKMVAGEEILESSLHQNLIEHLNAEIGLGTINNIPTAKKWLSSTFLNVRLHKNPKYYSGESDYPRSTPDETLLQWCEESLDLLEEANMIGNDGTLRCTEYGDAMARFCIKFETMKTFMAVPKGAKVSEVLNVLCQALEFQEYKLRQGEKAFYKELNQSNDTRYPISVDIALYRHKVSLIIQSKLGGIILGKHSRSKCSAGQIRQLGLDTTSVTNHAKRLIRCMIDILVQRNDSDAVRSALELARGLGAGVWDDTVLQLKQIPGLGDVSTRKLAAAGIKSIDALFDTEPHRIEVVLSKNPPFGLDLIKTVAEFPRLRISVKECGQSHRPAKGVEVKLRCEIGLLNDTIPSKFDRRFYSIIFLCETSHGQLIDFRRFSPSRLRNSEDILLSALVDRPHTKLRCHVMCDDLAGTHRFAELAIDCPISWLPKQSTIPEVSFRRPNMDTTLERVAAREEFDDEGVRDDDMLTVVQNFKVKEVVEDIDDIMQEVDDLQGSKSSRKRSRVVSGTQDDQTSNDPQKLLNGNWPCQHACKSEGKICKHKCCLEGVKNKPAKKRQKKDKEELDLSVIEPNKKGKKNVGGESKRGDTLQALWQLNKDRGDSLSTEATEQSVSKSTSRMLSPKDDATNDALSNVKADLLRDDLDLQQVVSDAFDLGDYDWQAIDEIAATLDDGAGAFDTDNAAELEQKMMTTGTFQEIESQNLEPPINAAYKQNSDPGGLFFTHTSSPVKDHVFHQHSDDTDIFMNHEIHPHLENDGSISKASRGIHNRGTSHPLPITNASPSVPSTDLLIDEEDELTNSMDPMQETEYDRRTRLEEEEQKKRWAELESDVLTYEAFGQYIRIVDDPE